LFIKMPCNQPYKIVKRVRYAQVTPISDNLVIYNGVRYMTKEDLKLFPSRVTLMLPNRITMKAKKKKGKIHTTMTIGDMMYGKIKKSKGFRI